MEVPCVKAYLRHVQPPKPRTKPRKIHAEVTIMRYAVWKDAPGLGRQQVYVAGQYPSLDDLAPGPYAPLRKTAVRYYGSKIPRNIDTWRVVQAQPSTWRKPTQGILQRVHKKSKIHHILPLVVLWNLAKSMLQTVTNLPEALDAQAITLAKKMKLAGFDLSIELAQLVVEHNRHPDCPDCHPSSPPACSINIEPAEARASAAACADAAVTAASGAARQAALLPYARLIREEERHLMTCLIVNPEQLGDQLDVLLDMLPADVAALLQMPENERQVELTRRVQQANQIQRELRHMFEVDWQQQQEQAGNLDAPQQGGATEAQQQQQQQQAANADVPQQEDLQVAHQQQQQQQDLPARSVDSTSKGAPAAAAESDRRQVEASSAAESSAAAAAAGAILPAGHSAVAASQHEPELQPAAAAAAAVAEEEAPAGFSSFLRYMFDILHWGPQSGCSRSHQQNGNPAAGEEPEVSSAPTSGNVAKPDSAKATAAAAATVSSSPRRQPGAPKCTASAQDVNEAGSIPLPDQQQTQQQQQHDDVRPAAPAVTAAAASPAAVTPPPAAELWSAGPMQQSQSPLACQSSSEDLAFRFIQDPPSDELPSPQLQLHEADRRLLATAASPVQAATATAAAAATAGQGQVLAAPGSNSLLGRAGSSTAGHIMQPVRDLSLGPSAAAELPSTPADSLRITRNTSRARSAPPPVTAAAAAAGLPSPSHVQQCQSPVAHEHIQHNVVQQPKLAVVGTPRSVGNNGEQDICQGKLQSGPKKGQPCRYPAQQNGYCVRHQRQAMHRQAMAGADS